MPRVRRYSHAVRSAWNEVKEMPSQKEEFFNQAVEYRGVLGHIRRVVDKLTLVASSDDHIEAVQEIHEILKRAGF